MYRGKYGFFEHHATNLHFDFRIAIGGVARSWAICDGPSLKPNLERIATEMPDHPLRSMNFEGTRRAGLYGAGEVCIWDRGEFQTEGDPCVALRNGCLIFSLHGTKLHGCFKLERHPNNDRDWTLTKLQDEFADPGFVLKTILEPRKYPGFFPLFESLDPQNMYC